MTNRPKPIERKVIAKPEDYRPSSSDLEIVGAFNPGATLIKTKKGLEKIILVRVAESPLANRNIENSYENERKIFLPFFHIPGRKNKKLEIDFDEYNERDINDEGLKEVKIPDGTFRMKHISLPRILRLDKNNQVIERQQTPTIYPSYEYERFGMEDFRITSFEDKRYLLTYVSPHRDFGVSTPFLITKDFKNYTRLPKEGTPQPIITGIKDVILFPEKIESPTETELVKKGQKIYAGFTRPDASRDVSKPGVWISYSPDLIHWGQDYRIIKSKNGEISGSGTPPIKVNKNWLAAYHETIHMKKGLRYNTKLMRLNSKKPWEKVEISDVLLKREDYLDILPKKGYVPYTVFTSGITKDDGITTFYSGIDDKWTVIDSFYTGDLEKFISKSNKS